MAVDNNYFHRYIVSEFNAVPARGAWQSRASAQKLQGARTRAIGTLTIERKTVVSFEGTQATRTPQLSRTRIDAWSTLWS